MVEPGACIRVRAYTHIKYVYVYFYTIYFMEVSGEASWLSPRVLRRGIKTHFVIENSCLNDL